MSIKVSDFRSIRLKLASPEEILSWSHGEVTKAETINYRTQRAEKDGLFCQKIFGPEKDWECYCGKYKRIRYKGVVCDKCGVEVTKASVRRERMGHIELACPIAHIWFLRGVPSKIGMLLDISVNQLEKVVYFASYIITKVDEEAKKRILEEIEREYKSKLKILKSGDDKNNKSGDLEELKKLEDAKNQAVEQVIGIKKFKVLSEMLYHDLSIKYGEMFEAGVGAEALKKLTEEIDLVKLKKELERELKEATSANQKKLLKRLKLVQGFLKNQIRPEWMFLTVLPVIPPELRPMVPLDGGRYASSDLNDLYRRVINRNNRLKKLKELHAPEVIARNEKRMLQEAVDALIDNSARKGAAIMASTGQKRQLRSLANMLKGKRGRFRQNLLGKRVDYSGRSVIVVGPELKLDQCGLPKQMALELFKPFVIQKLIELELAHNVRQAGRMIDEKTSEVWAILEDVIKDKYVLLNRAPTLHRLGIQAFRPIMTEGMAVRVHPLVCRAFNADFDGDQMAVHLPLGVEAQEEAKNIMLSSKNLLKPSTGSPIVSPEKDIVLGCYFLTKEVFGALGEGKVFSSKNEAVLAYEYGSVSLHSKVKVLIKKPKRTKPDEKYLETTPGRIIFSRALPNGYGFVNREMNKKALESLTVDIIEKYGIDGATPILDIIKQLGFSYASRSGISWGMDDLKVPEQKEEIIKNADKEVNEIQQHYLQGLLTDNERYDKVVEIWSNVKSKIASIVPESLDKNGSVYSIISSGARGSWSQPVQMSGMKGPVVNPSGDIIELPIKKSYKEGLGVLEYFISTHGARKGAADTALRTASAGYLTRRLVDVSQDVIVREKDCGDKTGIYAYREDAEAMNQPFAAKLIGRILLEDVRGLNGKKIVAKEGILIDKYTAAEIDKSGVNSVKIRSVLSCKAEEGLCAKCYGYELGRNELVKVGAAVGIVAAQAIGEPGTQLTMRTFHTGGVAGGGDITQGLPRVEEIFEARVPKGEAPIAEADGQVIDIEATGKFKIIKIKIDKSFSLSKTKKKTGKNAKKLEGVLEYKIPPKTALWVGVADKVKAGQQLCEGHIDLKKLFAAAGQEAVQRYVLKETQQIYAAQGEAINDRHIEIILRQMFSRVKIKDPGDTGYSADDVVDKQLLSAINSRLKKEGKQPAKFSQILYGITKVALSTESFLSSASFQETSRVLINAAVEAKEDHLRGLKENVIIGRLIPAGTGFWKNKEF